MKPEIGATTAEQPRRQREEPHQGDQGRAAEPLDSFIGLEHPEGHEQRGRQQPGHFRG
jgi:hypothetical protein